jgi:hypothetical protein
MLDFTKFNFQEIFGVVESTASMKRRQLRTLRAEIQERGIAKYSGGQLTYVGNIAVGQDFLGTDNKRYESKGQDGIFCKTKPWTKQITLKNFLGNNSGLPDQTFDYMLLWDTKTYSVGICSWEACMKQTKVVSDSVKFKVHFDDITFLATKVVPSQREDLGKQLEDFIESAL